jgi:excisionase family DNA binding protein
MKRSLNVREAAERAGVSTAIIYRWCEERRLAQFRPGAQGKRGKILIDPRDLDDFLESLKVTPGSPPGTIPFTHRR